jgi:hypothetical protein
MFSELIGSVVAFLLTIMILSYAVGDNPAFRIAVHIFVGVVAGYVAAVACWQVLWPDLLMPLLSGTAATRATLAVPLLLSGMMLMKSWPALSRLGMPALGYLVGAAAAAAIGGAVQGTLLPQAYATVNSLDAGQAGSLEDLVNALLVLGGVTASLAYFHFSARSRSDGTVRRFGVIELAAAVGAVFLAITLGVLFAGVYSAALTALIERLHFVGSFFIAG